MGRAIKTEVGHRVYHLTAVYYCVPREFMSYLNAGFAYVLL